MLLTFGGIDHLIGVVRLDGIHCATFCADDKVGALRWLEIKRVARGRVDCRPARDDFRASGKMNLRH
jgi:hypothetical protein